MKIHKCLSGGLYFVVDDENHGWGDVEYWYKKINKDGFKFDLYNHTWKYFKPFILVDHGLLLWD